MNATLAAFGLAALLAPAALSGKGPRLRASSIIAFARATVPLGLLLIMTATLATTMPTLLRILSLSGFASLCGRLVDHMVVGGRAGALVGGGLAVGIGATALRGLLVARRNESKAYVEEWIGTHTEDADCTVVVLPIEKPIAFVAAGSPPQLVLSEGVVERLSNREREVVVAHERAHIDGRHFHDLRLIAAVRAGLGWVPGVSRSLDFWGEALEWHADDRAAMAVDSRRCVANTIRNWQGQGQHGALSFNGIEPVVRRLEYLKHPRPTSRIARLTGGAAVAAIWVGASMVVFRWLTHAHSVALGASFCPL